MEPQATFCPRCDQAAPADELEMFGGICEECNLEREEEEQEGEYLGDL